MKRAAPLILCLVTVAVDLWVINASQTLDSVCTLNAHTGGGNACVYGLPFSLLGIALTATGVVSMIIALSSSMRSARRKLTRGQRSAISTLPQPELESLREVA
jgi:hypothetical protein